MIIEFMAYTGILQTIKGKDAQNYVFFEIFVD